MNHVAGFEIAAGRNDGITDRTAADALAFFINLRTAFGVDRAIGARAFVELPMRRCDDSIRILVGNVAHNQFQHGLADGRLKIQI
jgi:hypothetical protein